MTLNGFQHQSNSGIVRKATIRTFTKSTRKYVKVHGNSETCIV